LRWRLRYVVATLIAIATAIVALDSSSLSGKSLPWLTRRWTVLLSVFILGFAVMWNFFDAEVERRRLHRRHSIAVAVSAIAFAVWNKVHRVGYKRWTKERIGLHVWMVPTWHWTLVPRWIRKLTPRKLRAKLPTPSMWRAAQFRLRETSEPSDILWRRDVGAIGACWRDRKSCFYDLEALWGNQLRTEAEWRTLRREVSLGLDYSQYATIREKYASVLAVPIFRHPDRRADSEFIGCVVVDTPKDGRADIDTPYVRGALLVAAQQISSRLQQGT
jgi:hypothetical protein